MTEYDLNNYDYQLLHNNFISKELILRYRVIPLEKKSGALYVGTTDPTDQYTMDIITFHTGLRTFPIIIPEDKLNQIIKQYCEDKTIKNHLELGLLKEITFEDHPLILQENIVNYDEPLIKFVDHVIKHAIEQSASDIHVEPCKEYCRIRYRRDGVLHEITQLPVESANRFITRLKVMAKLDIAERRLPQDGRIYLHGIDIRINTCPTIFGEKMVLRLLDANKYLLDLNSLGFSEMQKSVFISTISKPHGLILVTGPTGCGKTVTLYSALNYLNNAEKNISTVEDPVEIQLAGINQVSIQTKIGLDFSTVLRTLLRQDPDVIMIGEIRDKETADIAIQAAHTGHLVLSTLHTNSAIETVSRLTSIGISTYNIANAISLIIAQRLMRKLCDYCKQPDTNNSDDIQHVIFRPVGCKHCLHGYQGRTGVYEFLPFTELFSELILAGENSITIKTAMKNNGFHLLFEMGKEKVFAGLTSLEELNRILQT